MFLIFSFYYCSDFTYRDWRNLKLTNDILYCDDSHVGQKHTLEPHSALVYALKQWQVRTSIVATRTHFQYTYECMLKSWLTQVNNNK